MTDREAIKRLSLMAEGGTNFSKESNEACRIGAAALKEREELHKRLEKAEETLGFANAQLAVYEREREERSKGCELCSFIKEYGVGRFTLIAHSFTGGDRAYDLKCGCCPRCGRSLKGTDDGA